MLYSFEVFRHKSKLKICNPAIKKSLSLFRIRPNYICFSKRRATDLTPEEVWANHFQWCGTSMLQH